MSEKTKIVTLDGDWDIKRRSELEALLDPLYIVSGDIVLDLTGVRHADSTVLASLIVLRNRRRTIGLPLPRLVIASKHVRRLFTIAGLDEAFPIFESLEEAQTDA